MKSRAFSAVLQMFQHQWIAAALTVFALFSFGSQVQAEEAGNATITEIIGKKVGDTLKVSIKGDASLTFTSYELPNPTRVVVDVANARLQPGAIVNLPGDDQVKLQTKEIADAQPQILRLEFLLEKSVPFTTKQDGSSLFVDFEMKGNEAQTAPVASSVQPVAPQSALEKHLPDTTRAGRGPVSGKLQDDFSFSGYDRERISVDFYKMDLHNVFRFLREISGTNIIVDESVQGSLTLTLDNVPWDFALDVILNLKDLRQEERFNTIVIYPKDKEFAWPGKAESKLSFEADEHIAQQEALIITQMDQQPPGLVEATQLIAKAREFEKQHNPAMAAQTYEEAFTKWNTNAKLANRIAAIYLVDLRQNTKALHYAKQALSIDKTDKVAALNAAIAAANMRDLQTATIYFDMSIQGDKPSQEALLSYALFREENRQYEQALQLLDKHEALYGKSLDTMIATARIFDKNGAGAQAIQEYRSILGSGFAIPPDLSRFIKARIGMVN
ncbi:MAG: secretin and TonB N-terminal domain-containing protein [bacterium]|nr:secretin and TonB N-terminal domain-containing protein [bacterium]